MSNADTKSGFNGILSRRSLATAGVATVFASAAGSKPADAQGTQIDPSPFYPAVTPGIAPAGEKIAPYTAACVQSPIVPTFDASGTFIPEALAHNVDVMCDLIARGAGDHGARLMSFPEFGLQIPTTPLSPAQWWQGSIRADGPEIEKIGEAAQRANAFVAFNPIEGIAKYPNRYFLSGMVVGASGDLVLNYRKLTGLTSKTRPGDILSEWIEEFGEDSLFPVADTEIGRLACVIAGDMNFPEIARAMTLKGAEVLLSPTASGYLAEDYDVDIPNVSVMTRRVRAFENVAYVLLSDLGPMATMNAAPQPPYPRRQPSQVIDFKGNLLARTESGGVEFAAATIDIDALRRMRTSLGGFNTMVNHLQMPLFHNMYTTFEGAPVNTHLDAPMESSDELREIQRDTIARMVEQGVLVPPGV